MLAQSEIQRSYVDYPASYNQIPLWFFCQIEPDNPTYNTVRAVRLHQKIDFAAARRALQRIVDRHEPLRTTFHMVDGELFQRVHEFMPVDMSVVDVQGWSQDEVDDVIRREMLRTFDLATDTLLRVTFFQEADARIIVLINMHHIVTDLWSFALFIHESDAYYNEELGGTPVNLKPIRNPYRVLQQKQRTKIEGPDGDRMWAYWQQKLSGELPRLLLPTDRPRSKKGDSLGHCTNIYFDAQIVKGLKSLAEKHGASLQAVMMAAYNLLLYRYTGQTDVLIGFLKANRTIQASRLIGYFVNPVVIRSDLSNDPSFEQLLARVGGTLEDGLENGAYPFSLLVEKLKHEQSGFAGLQLDIMFGWQKTSRMVDANTLASFSLNADGTKMAMTAYEIESKHLRDWLSPFDLTLFIAETDEDLMGVMEYSAHLFDDETIDRMIGHFQQLLRSIIAAPDRPITQLSMLLPSEMAGMQTLWMKNRLLRPNETIHAGFEVQAVLRPTQLAVIQPAFGDRSEFRLTYDELNRLANQVAVGLRLHGIDSDSLVGVALPKTTNLLVGLLSILKAGGGYLPLDPTYPTDHLNFMIDDSAIEFVLTEKEIWERAEWGEQVTPIFLGDLSQFLFHSDQNLDVDTTPDHLAYVIYTSGSTGRPKGVMVNHRSVVNHNDSLIDRLHLTASDRMLQFATINFDTAVEEIFPTLRSGGTLVLRPDEVPTLHDLTRLIGRYHISVLDLPTGYWHIWVDELERSTLNIPTTVRAVIVGGEKVLSHHLARWQKMTAGRDIRWFNTYGPTEATIIASWWEAPRGGLWDASVEVPIGSALPNVRLYVLDDQLNLVPIGVPGELYIGGDAVVRGYLGQPDLTTERFLPDPFDSEPGGRMYKTGDLVRRLADHSLQFLGRVDHQVKIRGFRVEPGAIESMIVTHPAVQSAVVLSFTSQQQSVYLAAYFVPTSKMEPDGAAVTGGDLKTFLRRLLPDYMIPDYLLPLDELPLLPNGKIDRKRLPEPRQLQQTDIANYVAPRSKLEQALIEIWESCLEVSPIGVFDNFFELGGQSLLATQIISRIRTDYQTELSLRLLFETPTVAALAAAIEEAQTFDSASLSIDPAPRNQVLPLSFAQQRLWFIDQLDPDNPAYNLPIHLLLKGRLDLDLFQRVLMTIAERHEALRTRFVAGDDGPAQQILEAMRPDVTIIDLSDFGTSHKVRISEALRLARTYALEPFALQTGPLWRVHLISITPDAHMALINMHHIISDGWSYGVLVREVAALYQAFLNGEENPLPPLSIQFADYVIWQRAWLRDEALQRQLDYWADRLADAPPLLELPTDFSRPPMASARGSVHTFELSADLSAAVRRYAVANGVTPFITLLAVYQVLLSRYSGQTDILVGSPIANRTRPELEPLIGFFVNTLVMRADLSRDLTFDQLVDQVKETALGAYAHQDVPFEHLVQALQPDRNISFNPIFQVMFVLNNAPLGKLELSDLSVEWVPFDAGISNFDLCLIFEEVDGLFKGKLEFSTDLFKKETIQRMAGHYQTLLAAVLSGPTRPLTVHRMLSSSEELLLVHALNQARVLNAPAEHLERPVHYRFEAVAASFPNRIAVQYKNEQLRYVELNRRANQLAHALQKMGVGPETLVGICHGRSVDLLIAVLGVLKAGGAYLPIKPDLPTERITDMVADSGIEILITESMLTAHPAFVGLNSVVLDADHEKIELESDENLPAIAGPSDLAYMIYTSGSTGRPKGVMIEHRNLSNALVGWEVGYDLENVETHLNMANFSFDVFTGDWVRALTSGARLLLCPYDVLLQPAELFALLTTERVEAAEFVPAVLRQLIDHMAVHQLRLDHLKLLLCGSDSWYAGEYNRTLRFCGPQTRLINSFGLTEATIDSSYFESNGLSLAHDHMVPIGKPFANVRFYILDPQLKPTPIGVTGELYIGGAGIARGYHNRPTLTAERFLQDYFVAGGNARMYKTGDQARFLPDGNVEFLGRLDNQIKIRGFRIEPGEIEAVIEQLPHVQSVAVVARQPASAQNQRLVAYVVTGVDMETSGLKIQDVRNHVQACLPDYMVPAVVMFLEELPLTPNGKVNRAALPEPDWTQRLTGGAYIPPRNGGEEMMAEIWSELLDIEKVGAYDNFFALGGHSLLATQLMSRIRNRFNVEMSVRTVFEAPILAELAERAGVATRALQTPPIVPVPREGELPLSFAQQRLWFLDQLEPHSAAYNVPEVIRGTGRLDISALNRALQTMIERHEILRTTFKMASNGDPVVNIVPQLELRFESVDLRWITDLERREVYSKEMVETELQRPFDLATGPLIRATLIRLTDEDQIILFVIHHIVTDGWSSSILVDELTALYTAYAAGMASPLQPLTLQYLDFAVWQRNWLQGEPLEEIASYWRKQLAGLPPLLELPTDFQRPPEQTYNGAYYNFELPPALAEQVYTFCRQEGVTPFMALLAIFQTVLGRYARVDDVPVGTPIANRNRSEIERMIGFFVNTLVLRGDLSGRPSFRELLSRTREMTLDAYAHQDLPFENLVDLLDPERNIAYNPIFQVMFALQNVPDLNLELSGLTFSAVDMDVKTSTFDLSLFFEEGEGSDRQATFLGAFEYNTDLFRPETIQRLAGHVEALLTAALAEPDKPLVSLSMLPAAEERFILQQFNRPTEQQRAPVEMPGRPVHYRFEEIAAQTPAAIAVQYGDQALTYDELNRRANRLARYLQRQQVGPESLVAICHRRSVELLVAVLGVLKAGGAYLPLNPNHPDERIGDLLHDSGVTLLLTEERLEERPIFADLLTISLDGDSVKIGVETDENLLPLAGPSDLAYMIYTSGSTGRPKGVMIEHRNLANALHAWEKAFDLDNLAVHLQMANFAFDVFTGDWVRALCSGAKLVLCPPEWLLEPHNLYQLLARERVEAAEFVPAVLRQLMAYMATDRLTLNHLKLLSCGSDIWYAGEYKRFRQFCGPQTRLINSFGLTEATIDSSYFESDGLDMGSEQIVPIGKPFTNMRFYILDEQMRPTPIGVPGELYIGGEGVARGYYNRPELTAERFLPDPFVEDAAARLYKTGDQARYLADGNVEFIGRLDSQLKIRGFRIEPGEIEAAIEQHPDVAATAVIGKTVQGGQRLVAYIVPREEAVLATAMLRHFLQERLPDYMVPTAILFLPDLPLTPNGKIDRRALPEPEWGERFLDQAYVAPQGEVETALCEIWSELLGVEQVGRYDNFFDLGGHSIMAMRFIVRVRERFEIDLPVARLFDHQTVTDLAALIGQLKAKGGESGLPRIEPLPTGTAAPLSFSQQRLWFVDQLEPENIYYNMPLGVRLTGLLDAEQLEAALNEIVARHAVLRTTFHEWDHEAEDVDGPIQTIQPARPLDFEQVDLRQRVDATPEELEQEVERLVRASAEIPFDLTRDQLMRGRLIRIAEQEHVLILTIHHIAFDGWSQGIFVAELTAIYRALVAGHAPALPALPIQYADFAAWQRTMLSGAMLAPQSLYWREKLAGVPPLLELPTDRPRPAVQSNNGAYFHFELSAELGDALNRLSRAENSTLFMSLLAGFEIMLARYSGQDDFCVGTPVANRNRPELEGLLGFFVNNLVMRADLSGELSVRDHLERVRQTALDAYRHQDMPFEMLVEQINPTRDLSYAPLFQVLFTLDNTPAGSIDLDELTLSPLALEAGALQFDLALSLTETETGISGQLEYSVDLFEKETISRMVGHFRTILEQMVADVLQPVHQIEMLTAAEAAHLLVDLNQNRSADIEYEIAPFHAIVAAHAAARPEHIAVTFDGESVSYGELEKRTNRLARVLQKRGVKRGTLVGLSVERSPDIVIGMLAILKAGGAFLPLDPNFPQERIVFMLADAGLEHLVTRAHLIESGPLNAVDDVDLIFLDRDHEIIAQESATPLAPVAAVDDIAYVIYTSGSTGRPKGALIEHQGYVNASMNYIEQIGLSEQSRVLQVLSFGFDASLIEIGMALLSGGTLAIPTPETVMSMPDLHRFIQREALTAITMTPSMLALLPSDELPQLEAVISGGEALPTEVISRWGENRRFFNAYGPTETSIAVTMTEVNREGTEDEPVTIGRPFKNVSAYIVNEHLQPVPLGLPGELVIGGLQVGRGYLKRPELTAEKFVENRFATDRQKNDSNRLYRTGDLVRYLPDGRIAFLGRIDNQVKLRGFRIELGEIENAVRTFATVRDCVVVMNEDVPGSKRLIAYLLSETKAQAEDQDSSEGEGNGLRTFLQEALPDYMIPSLFVTLDQYPTLPSGKIDRKALAARPVLREALTVEFVAPRNEIEQTLAEMVGELLKIDQVGVHDNFFELGGHSLLGTQLVSRIRKRYEVDLPLRKLFTDPTVAALAAEIEAGEAAQEVNNELADMLSMLDELSDDEALALLEEGGLLDE